MTPAWSVNSPSNNAKARPGGARRLLIQEIKAMPYSKSMARRFIAAAFIAAIPIGAQAGTYNLTVDRV